MTQKLPWEDDPEDDVPFTGEVKSEESVWIPDTQENTNVQEGVSRAVNTDLSEIFANTLQDTFRESIKEAAPELQKMFATYVSQLALSKISGKEVDLLRPTVTGITVKGKELKIADAKNRSIRTFWQGLGIDLAFAFIGILATLSTFDPFERAGWVTLGVLVFKTIVQTIVSYISRLKITPGGTIEGEPVKLLPTAIPKPKVV